MKFISKQEGFALKAQRQLKLKKYSDEFKIHCGGAVAHYGKIPKGCAACIFGDVVGTGIFLGSDLGLKNVCNANCKHCFAKLGDDGPTGRSFGNIFNFSESDYTSIDAHLAENGKYGIFNILPKLMYSDSDIVLFSIGGEGSEPLLYLPAIEKLLQHFKENIEPNVAGKDFVYKLYTNGSLLSDSVIDKLSSWGINELRVNPSAFKFSDDILENLKRACKVFPVVTTEIGVFPEYYDDIYRCMPIFEEMGLSHMSMCQPKYRDYEVLTSNSELFSEDAVCYVASNDWVVVDDGGEVENIIKFAIDNKFSYSILDCNGILMSQEKREGGLGKKINNIDFKDVINI